MTSQLSASLGGLSELTVGRPEAPIDPHATGGDTIINPGGERELILIIDDEEVIGQFAGEMLGNQGYRVAVALEPFRALEMFKKYKDEVALVILDFTLPIMDGSEVFDELRKLKPQIAVMLSSGFAEQDKVRAMLAKGLRGFLPKPYTEEKLLAQVRMVLNSIRAEKTGERRIL